MPAKVIDDEDPAGGFQLQWGLIGFGRGVVDQIEHVERQLAAGDDGRPLAADVPSVETGHAAQGRRVLFGGGDFVVDDRIEYSDHLAGVFNGARDIHLISQRVADAVRN